jgi:hypothetical protein
LSFRRIKGKSRKSSGCPGAAMAGLEKTSEFGLFETGGEYDEGFRRLLKAVKVEVNVIVTIL